MESAPTTTGGVGALTLGESASGCGGTGASASGGAVVVRTGSGATGGGTLVTGVDGVLEGY